VTVESIKITEHAATEIRRIYQQRKKEEGYDGIRIEAQGGGCSGYRYNITLEREKKMGDDVSEQHGVKIYYNAILFKPLLDGMTIDFMEGLMGGGCQGCAASSVTLKAGVESMIKAKVDEINEIVDITNHDAGINPYYKKGSAAIQQAANPSPLVKGR